jgi:3-methyl-2-oxobutanoate hydroxymethyltransferase
MSTQTARPGRLTVPDIARRKGDAPVVCLTAYTAPMARLIDPHVDLLLVGDSLGMVIYGYDSTLPVTLDMMVAHGAAVVRGSQRALVAVDMPFASYQASPADAFRACARVMAETGCGAVKLEGGAEMAETIAFLTARGIPVMGHVGLKPQSVHAHGGYRFQGREEEAARAILADAAAVAEAGAFCLVVEAVAEPLAAEIARSIPVPAIGIGASPACDGQVLVAEDMLGLFPDFTPKFVKRYGDLAGAVGEAVAAYAAEVRARRFPGPEHCFAVRGTAAV